MTRPTAERITLILLTVVFGTVLIRNAWVTEDAYITFRTVDNFVHGHGLRWNVAERVQAYTNPLWMFVMSLLYTITGEVYFTSIALSLVLSACTAALLIWGLAAAFQPAVLVLTLLIFSRAFVDFSVSGLEDPLSHMLLVAFAFECLRREPDQRSMIRLSLLASLAMLCRLDNGLLVLPTIGDRLLRGSGRTTWFGMALGLTPILLWETFSLLYYGSLVPNTAYAKLGTGLARPELASQGLLYLLQSLKVDPLTMLTIILATITAVASRDRRLLMVALGITLFVTYIVWAGGDFMAGRFLTEPFVVAVSLVAVSWTKGDTDARPSSSWFVALAAVATVGLLSEFPPITTRPSERGDLIDENGIANERAYYYGVSNLLEVKRQGAGHWSRPPDRPQERSADVRVLGTIGYSGFIAHNQTHIVDPMGLSDPLLARLPIVHRAEERPLPIEWRVGHYVRHPPDGYLQSLQRSRNLILDEHLAEYYDVLSLIVRGPLFDPGRLVEIAKLNLGVYDHLIEAYVHNPTPRVIRATVTEVSEPTAIGAAWDHPRHFQFAAPGLEVYLEEEVQANALELSLDNNDDYVAVFLRRGIELGRVDLAARPLAGGGMNSQCANVPAEVVRAGFDRVVIKPVSSAVLPTRAGVTGDNYFSLGYLRLRATFCSGAAPPRS